MALVPFTYNLRSLLVRRAATLLTVLGIGATVATVAGVLALQQGFAALYADTGREDLAVLMRPGALSEGVSQFRREGALHLAKSRPEFEVHEGQPLASMETFLAVRRFRVDGTETNVPLRGVQPATFAIRGDDLRIVAGRHFQPGADEVIVGRGASGRIQDCEVGDVLTINTTPFRVVGVFACEGPFESEVWGDFDRMVAALERFGPNRLLAKLKPTDEMPLQQLGATYLARAEDGDRARASQSFKQSNAVRPNAVSFANLGYIAYSEQRYDEAIRDYEQAANLEPTLAAHWGNLGDAYRKRGRKGDATVAYNQAIAAGENALKVNQNDAAMESLLGLYYAKVGSKIEAERYTRRAFATNPSDLDVLYRRAAALALIGQREEAVRRLTEAIDRGLPFHQVRDDDDLASLQLLPAFKRLAAAATR